MKREDDMKRIVLTLGLTGLLCAAGPSAVRADHFCDADVCFVRADRPQWVMVFSVTGGGDLTLERGGRSAVFVGAGSSHRDCFASGGRRMHGGGYHVVVTSDRPFGLPRNFARSQSFQVRSQWGSQHTKRLCRLLGVRPGSVHVAAFAFEPEFRRRRDQHTTVCGHSAWPWAGLHGEDQVYVDGIFRGLGVSALIRVSSGGHRVTVVSSEGRKQSRWVAFGTSSCEPTCPVRLACR